MEALLQFFFPARCAGCRRYDAEGLCRLCRLRLSPFPLPFRLSPVVPGLSLGDYAWPLREAILELKYKNLRVLGRTLGRLLASAIRMVHWDLDRVVPTPMAPNRFRERAYNHAALLAKSVARSLGALYGEPLGVTRPLSHQVGLGRKERKQNVRGAFQVRSPDLVLGRKIVLVDDVVTTGATLSECVSALMAAGADRVYAACVAMEHLDPKG